MAGLGAPLAVGLFVGAVAVGVLLYVDAQTPATPAGLSFTLAPGARALSIPTGSTLTVVPPAGGAITDVASQSANSDAAPPSPSSVVFTNENANDVLTFTWNDAGGNTQQTTLTLTVTA